MNNEYRVVRIIDDTALIVNAGTENEIEVGDIMEICGRGATIVDPETNIELGRLDNVKAKLNVTEVYDKMCVCETPYVSDYMSTFLTSSIFRSTQKKLDVEPTDITGEGDKTIRIGDIAKHIKTIKEKIQETVQEIDEN